MSMHVPEGFLKFSFSRRENISVYICTGHREKSLNSQDNASLEYKTKLGYCILLTKSKVYMALNKVELAKLFELPLYSWI